MTDVLHDPAAGITTADKADDDPFGWSLSIDLYDCDLDTISSGPAVAWWMVSLCERVLHMERHGDILAERFGRSPKTRGFTVGTLLTDSNAGAHFSEHRQTGHADVFSCKWYDPDEVIAFTCDFFGAQLRYQWFLERR